MQDLSQLPEDVRARVLILAGVGEETKTGVLVEAEGPRGRVQNFFNFDAKEEGAGDGTVPLQSAAFFKDSIQTLKVDSKWYDKATHAFFLNDGRVQTIIKRFFRDETSSWCWWSDAGGTVDQM